MVNSHSMVFGSISHETSRPTYGTQTGQEFAKDEVVIDQSLDTYSDIVKAKQIISSGKCLALESGAFGPARQISQR